MSSKRLTIITILLIALFLLLLIVVLPSLFPSMERVESHVNNIFSYENEKGKEYLTHYLYSIKSTIKTIEVFFLISISLHLIAIAALGTSLGMLPKGVDVHQDSADEQRAEKAYDLMQGTDL